MRETLRKRYPLLLETYKLGTAGLGVDKTDVVVGNRVLGVDMAILGVDKIVVGIIDKIILGVDIIILIRGGDIIVMRRGEGGGGA